jgi:hypothetical protein
VISDKNDRKTRTIPMVVEKLDINESVDHSVAQGIAKHIGAKLKNFSHDTYNKGGRIPGATSYTFDKEVTHDQVKTALSKSGFKPPSFSGLHKDHEAMKSVSDSHISPTHTARVSIEHGQPLRLHIQDRNANESILEIEVD